MQSLIIVIVVALSAWFAYRKLRRSARLESSACGCSGCSCDCPAGSDRLGNGADGGLGPVEECPLSRDRREP